MVLKTNSTMARRTAAAPAPEYRAEPWPAMGTLLIPEVVVAGADDAADQRHGDDHVELSITSRSTQ